MSNMEVNKSEKVKFFTRFDKIIRQ